jgi:hypothetical protein
LEGLTEGDQNDKIIQVLAYAYMKLKLNQNPLRQELFQEFKIGVLPFNFKEEKREYDN